VDEILLPGVGGSFPGRTGRGKRGRYQSCSGQLRTSNAFSRKPVVPSVFVMMRFQVPCDFSGMVKNNLIWVVSERSIVVAIISAFPLRVSFAVSPFWKFDPKTVMGRYVLEVAANHGSILVMPIPPAEVVVSEGLTDPWMMKRLV
jgi:hypothetical protein